MHVLNDRICNNSVNKCARYLIFCTQRTGGMSSRTCCTKLNFDFPYLLFIIIYYLLLLLIIYYTSYCINLYLYDRLRLLSMIVQLLCKRSCYFHFKFTSKQQNLAFGLMLFVRVRGGKRG